jgi:AraC family transcriptional regulator
VITQKDIYATRINLALNYVNDNLNKKISIEDLASAAHFSPFHFHRIFQTLMNESVGNYINRIKLEKASQKLSYTNKSILEISLDLGFSSIATFSRAFKNYFDSTPTHYRKNGLTNNSKICKNTLRQSTYFDPMKEEKTVIIKELEFENIAYITVFNAFEEGKSLKALNKLMNWSKEVGTFNAGEILGMSPDDAVVTPKDKYRYLIGITVPVGFLIEDPEIKSMRIPKSKYAMTKASGKIENVINSWNYLYNNWLINSTYEPNHLYAFEKIKNKEKANDWSSFDLELYLPIKQLYSS